MYSTLSSSIMSSNGGYGKHRKRTTINTKKVEFAEADQVYAIVVKINGSGHVTIQIMDDNGLPREVKATLTGKMKRRNKIVKDDIVLCVADYTHGGVYGIIHKYLPHEVPQIQAHDKYKFPIKFSTEVFVSKEHSPKVNLRELSLSDDESDEEPYDEEPEKSWELPEKPIFVPSLDDL